jgi:hypothetical protein
LYFFSFSCAVFLLTSVCVIVATSTYICHFVDFRLLYCRCSFCCQLITRAASIVYFLMKISPAACVHLIHASLYWESR